MVSAALGRQLCSRLPFLGQLLRTSKAGHPHCDGASARSRSLTSGPSHVGFPALRSALPARPFVAPAAAAAPPATAHQPLDPTLFHCWYADHQVVTLPGGHRFPMDKYRMTRNLLESEQQTAARMGFHPSPAAPLPDLLRVHTSDYVDRFVSGDLTKQDMRAIGFPWSESLVGRNLASVGGTLAATQALLRQPQLRMTAHISGGTHHAFAERGEGFCAFNDIAVGVQWALDEHRLERVLVIDLDVHQGNGTAAIFAGDARVTTFDCFCDSNYPWRTRHPSTIDVPLADDTSDESYLGTLQAWLPRLAALKPQLVVFQAGVDALADDSLGNMRLSRTTLNARNNAVYSFALGAGVPLVVCMGGGYAKPDIAPSVAAHADVYRTAALRLHAVARAAA